MYIFVIFGSHLYKCHVRGGQFSRHTEMVVLLGSTKIVCFSLLLLCICLSVPKRKSMFCLFKKQDY
jgi:hypothetical protein